MFDSRYVTHDAAVVSITDDTDGVSVSEDGDTTIKWGEVPTVTIDNPPYADSFETDTFYKLPVTAARPIVQTYHYGEDGVVHLKKPRRELKQAAWSLDRRPVTLGHPDEKVVKSHDEIHGFWSDITYVDSADDLRTNGYVPVNDDEAQSWIEDNTDVSVGFAHDITRIDEYDGAVGGTDAPDAQLDGYQTDIYFDHLAFVGRGRCSGKDGCGLDDAGIHGTTTQISDSFINTTAITQESEQDSSMNTTDAPSGIYESDGGMYGIAPDEGDGDEPKYPMNNCSDVYDAWHLRGHGEYAIEQSTLEQRIQRMAEYHDCDRVPGQSNDCGNCDDCDCNDDTTDMTEFSIDLSDLSTEAALDKLGEQHDGIADLADDVAEMRDAADVATEVADTLDTDVESLPDRVDELQDKADAYAQRRREEMVDMAEDIADIVDKYDEADEVLDAYDEDYDRINDQLETLKSVTNSTDEPDEETDTSSTTIDSQPNETDADDETTREIPSAWR